MHADIRMTFFDLWIFGFLEGQVEGGWICTIVRWMTSIIAASSSSSNDSVWQPGD